MRELSDDRQLGGHQAAPAAQQAMLARQRLAVASERAQAAAARAVAAREASALAHDRAAALYDRLALGGYGDAGEHRPSRPVPYSSLTPIIGLLSFRPVDLR